MRVTTPSLDSPELGRELTAGARAWRFKAREFAEDVVGPVGRVLDRMGAREAVAPGSPVYEFLAQAHREGFTRLTDPRELGGLGLSRAEEVLVLEELATADAGLAAVLVAAPLPYRWSYDLGGPELIRELVAPWYAGDRTDWVGCCAMRASRGRVRATPDRDGWLLAGSAPASVAGAATATHAVLSCTAGLGGQDTELMGIVPLDHPGVSRRPPPDRMGLRTLCQAQIVLDGVRLPREHILVHPDPGVDLAAAARAIAHAATAVLAVGVGRAAYEGALRCAHEDERDEHDAAGQRLFRMFTVLEAARAMARAAYLHVTERTDAGEPASMLHARAAHAFATEAASEIADHAMRVCGGRSTQRTGVEFLDGSAFHLEKLMRDAQSYKVAGPASASPALDRAAHHQP